MLLSASDETYLATLNDGVLQLIFNKPEAGNAIPAHCVPELTELLLLAQRRSDVRCLLVRGKGNVFCAGGDVHAFHGSLQQSAEERQSDFARRLPLLAGLVEAFIGFDRPIVASIRGAAAGAGLLYPLAADYVIADETARFVFAHRRIGLTPDAGITSLLPTIVGLRTARMLILTAATLDAQEALRLGIVHHVVPEHHLEEQAIKIATQLAQAPQLVVRMTKALISQNESNSLSEQLTAEGRAIVACVGDDDFEEGVRAFVEKRKSCFPSTLG